jgi:hypothetical protein
MQFIFLDGGEGHHIWTVAANIWNMQSLTDKGWAFSLMVGRVRLTMPPRKYIANYEVLHGASELAGSCKHGNEPSDFGEEVSVFGTTCIPTVGITQSYPLAAECFLM